MIDFPALHSDLLDEDVIEKFSEINEIILDTHNLTVSNEIYNLELVPVTGDLDIPGDHYFRLTGVIDGFQEQLLSENRINDVTGIRLAPRLKLGLENPRITAFKIYYSNDGITYSLITEFPIKEDTYNKGEWFITRHGTIALPIALPNTLYSQDSQAENDFYTSNNNTNQLLEFNGTVKATRLTTPGTGTNFIDLIIDQNSFSLRKLEGNKQYKVSFEYKTNNANLLELSLVWATPPTAGNYEGGVNKTVLTGNTITAEDDESFYSFEENFTIPNHFYEDKPPFPDIIPAFRLREYPTYQIGYYLEIKNFKIELLDIPNNIFNKDVELGTELNAEIGYTPTYDMVKGWDFALQLNGRIYYFNPYTDRRWENYVLVSAIHSSGAFQWDMASFANFRELERFDSSKVVAAILLPTTEIMVLKDKSIEILQDDGTVGILREPISGIGCISRGAAVRLLDTIVFPGVDDIYMFNLSGGVKGILKESIRDIYHAIDNKDKLVAIRDRYNTYRLRVYDDTDDKTERTEFLLTENGWVEEQKFHYPVFYREDFKGKLNFMAPDGKIYGTLYDILEKGYGREYSSIRYGRGL